MKTLADGADTAAQGFVTQANTAAAAALSDASTAPDVDTATMDSSNAQDIAADAFEAVNAVNPMPPYTPGSQAAQLIDAAMASAQAAQTAASACAGFANDADMDRQTVIARANDAHAAAVIVDMKVNDAISILNGGGFFFDFGLIFRFLDDLSTAFAEKAVAVQAKADAQTSLGNAQSNLTKAGGQLGLAQVAQTQTENDIAQAAAAAQAAATNGGSGTGDDHDGDDNSHKRPGGGHQG